MLKQITVRLRGDTYQRIRYLRTKMAKEKRTKVSWQQAVAEALVKGLDSLRMPRFPGEVDQDIEEGEL